MTVVTSLKCNNCGYTTDAPDKMQHFVQVPGWLYLIGDITLHFCSDGCKDDFAECNRKK